MKKGKIYLSGPDRLRKDAKERFEKKKELCESYGFELLEYPCDIYINKDTYDNNVALAKKRLKMIEDCDILIGDVNDFRAYVEPFGETALEFGIAYGFGKKIYGYMKDARNCAQRYSGEKTYDEENKRWTDKDGIGFEPGPVNLMLEYGGKIIEGDLEDALKLAGKEWEFYVHR